MSSAASCGCLCLISFSNMRKQTVTNTLFNSFPDRFQCFCMRQELGNSFDISLESLTIPSITIKFRKPIVMVNLELNFY